MLLDLASTWAKANCANPAFQHDFLRAIEIALRKKVDCYFSIGPDLMKKRKPYLVYFFADQFFVFGLNRQQAENLGAVKSKMRKTEKTPNFGVPQKSEMPVSVTQLEIDNGGHLNGGDRIAGRVHYEITGHLSEPIAMSLEYDLKDRALVQAFCLSPLTFPKSGIMEFSFSPIHSSDVSGSPTWSGTTAAFFRFVTIPNRQVVAGRVPVSNVFGRLLDVCSSGKP